MKNLQKRLHTYLVDTKSKEYFIVSDLLALLTIISIASLVLETVPRYEKYMPVFNAIEWITVFFFLIEYIARIIVTQPRRKYIFSFFGVIDLLAILPSFVGIGNFTFLKSARAIRLIRLLRIIRITKISRMGVHDVEESLNVFWMNVLLYIATLVVALLIIGSGIYFFEEPLGTVESIPEGIFWALKLFLENAPPVEPLTVGGQTFLLLARFVSLALLGVLITVAGNILSHYLYNKGEKNKKLHT